MLTEYPAQAQQATESVGSKPSVTVGYIKLIVGMPKDEALAALSGYNVLPENDEQRRLIIEKPIIRNGVADNREARVRGSIIFENGAVTEITSYWGVGQSGPEIESLWNSFWGAVTSTIPDNNKRFVAASLRAYTTKSPTYQGQTIDIRLNSNRIVSINRGAAEARPVGDPSARVLSNVSVEETVF